jgi:hypothetical protein
MVSALTNVHTGQKASFSNRAAERMFIEKTILPQRAYLKPLKSGRLRSIKCPAAPAAAQKKSARSCEAPFFVPFFSVC